MTMGRYYTSIEQSKKLLELGLKPETADFGYAVIDNESFLCTSKPTNPYFEHIPCWSVGALIDLMPILIDINRVWLTPHNGGYSCTYGSYKGLFHAETDKTAIDACYAMVVWLLENKYI